MMTQEEDGTHVKKIQKGYEFEFDDVNYSNKDKNKGDKNKKHNFSLLWTTATKQMKKFMLTSTKD